MERNNNDIIICKSKQNKGITLIALVITIIILLILAGVSIATITGDNGVLNKAAQAKEDNEFAAVKEAIKLAATEHTSYLYDNTTDVNSKKSFNEWLLDKGYIDTNNVFDVEKLTGQKMTTGKGDPTSGCDIYTITEEEKTGKVATLDTPSQVITHTKVYYIYYYNTEGYQQCIDTVELGEKRDTKVYEEGVFKITEDGLLDFIDKYAYKGTYDTVKYDENGETTLTIPETVKGIQVKELKPNFAWKVRGIKEVIINAKLEKIPTLAFMTNKDIEKITLPEGLKSIEYGAFYGCTKLNYIYMPNTVTDIKGSAFWGCEKLTNIELFSKLEKISSAAFGSCKSLQSITIPASVNNIDVEIGEEGARGAVFDGCTNLNEVNIKKGSPLLVNGEVPQELATKLGVDKSKIKIVD